MKLFRYERLFRKGTKLRICTDDNRRPNRHQSHAVRQDHGLYLQARREISEATGIPPISGSRPPHVKYLEEYASIYAKEGEEALRARIAFHTRCSGTASRVPEAEAANKRRANQASKKSDAPVATTADPLPQAIVGRNLAAGEEPPYGSPEWAVMGRTKRYDCNRRLRCYSRPLTYRSSINRYSALKFGIPRRARMGTFIDKGI